MCYWLLQKKCMKNNRMDPKNVNCTSTLEPPFALLPCKCRNTANSVFSSVFILFQPFCPIIIYIQMFMLFVYLCIFYSIHIKQCKSCSFSSHQSFQPTPRVCTHGLWVWWFQKQKIPTCITCECDVSSQSIIARLSPRQPCPTSPCSCIWGPIKQCLARWSHDPWGE